MIMYCEQTAGPRSTNFWTYTHVGNRRSPATFHLNHELLELHFLGQRFKLSTLGTSYVIISQTVKNQTNTTNRKLHVAFRLAYLHLNLVHSKGQGQGHAQFDC